MEFERRSARRRQRIPKMNRPERRSGFDRRGRHWAITLRDYPLLLIALLALLNVLNVMDWLLTAVALEAGATEANPIMAYLFDVGHGTAGIFKIAVFALVTVAIWRRRSYRRILEFATAATALYATLIAYQLVGLAVVLPVA